jgi:hypothetical protein
MSDAPTDPLHKRYHSSGEYVAPTDRRVRRHTTAQEGETVPPEGDCHSLHHATGRDTAAHDGMDVETAGFPQTLLTAQADAVLRGKPKEIPRAPGPRVPGSQRGGPDTAAPPELPLAQVSTPVAGEAEVAQPAPGQLAGAQAAPGSDGATE